MAEVRRCINIDWFECFVLEPVSPIPDAEFFRSEGIEVREREYGTRVYREMFVLVDENGAPWLEIRRNPFGGNSSVLPDGACHVRLTNYACYQPQIVEKLRDFLARYGYTFMRISRVDLCLDFIRFDSGDEPQKFIRRYMEGKYAKINQTHVAAHGEDLWDGRYFSSLAWGSHASQVSTKLYCKSKEMAEVKDKPWVRLSWFSNFLVDDPVQCTCFHPVGGITRPDIWRLEFSIKSPLKNFARIETEKHHRVIKDTIPNDLELYCSSFKKASLFFSLTRHYFHFKHFEAGQRKDRCPDKELFHYRPDDVVYSLSVKPSTEPRRDVFIKFRRTLAELALSLPETKTLCDSILQKIESKSEEQGYRETALWSDVRILQALIRERMNGYKPDLSKHVLQLESIFGEAELF